MSEFKYDVMAIIIPKKDYNITIGSPNPFYQSVRYIFGGWANQSKQNKYHNSLSFFASEMYAGRVESMSPAARAVGNIICWGSAAINSIEPPVGSIFDVEFDPRKADIEEIESFFRESGIAFHRADPFYKPTKTIGQLIRNFFAPKFNQ